MPLNGQLWVIVYGKKVGRPYVDHVRLTADVKAAIEG